MKLNRNHIIFYYLALYLSLLIGFYHGEDFAGGFKYDLQTHKFLIENLFEKGLIFGLLNYDIYYVPHSPIFVIYIIFLKKLFIAEEIYRIINLHISLLIPFFVGLSLKIKYKLKKNDVRYLLPSIFLFSPYFRAGSIWTDDNILAMVFLSISIFFFIKYEKNKDQLNNILFCTFFLALCAYFRPIYSIFSIYFFLHFFLDMKLNKKFFYYIFVNIFLALPAFYYVFILDINKWAISYLFRENLFTILSLVSSILIFYIFPFVIKFYKPLLTGIINIKNISLYFILLFSLFFFFEYDRSYSGGILFKFSYLIFGNNYFFYLISSLCILFVYILFFSKIKKKNIFDIVLIILLFLLEMDGVVYHETYDPLIYILVLLLLKNKMFEDFLKKFNFNNFLIIFFFLMTFYFSAVIKTIWL